MEHFLCVSTRMCVCVCVSVTFIHRKAELALPGLKGLIRMTVNRAAVIRELQTLIMDSWHEFKYILLILVKYPTVFRPEIC